jgi:hypothetical protein
MLAVFTENIVIDREVNERLGDQVIVGPAPFDITTGEFAELSAR